MIWWGILSLFYLTVQAEAPDDAVLVFNKGEEGYYCHRIPYLFHTQSHTLIALGKSNNLSLSLMISLSISLMILLCVLSSGRKRKRWKTSM